MSWSVLDEIINTISYRWLDAEKVVAALTGRPEQDARDLYGAKRASEAGGSRGT